MGAPSAAPAPANGITRTRTEIPGDFKSLLVYLDQLPRISCRSGSSHLIFDLRMKATATVARNANRIISQRIPISASVAVLYIARLQSAGFIWVFRASKLSAGVFR